MGLQLNLNGYFLINIMRTRGNKTNPMTTDVNSLSLVKRRITNILSTFINIFQHFTHKNTQKSPRSNLRRLLLTY